MEKRIKALYIITIIAILSFLSMQVYWLYGRYEFSLSEYEASAYKTIRQTVTELNQSRQEQPDSDGRTRTLQSKYSLNHSYDSVGSQVTVAVVSTQKYYAHELLGIKENRPLTSEEQIRVARLLLEDSTLVDAQEKIFDASNAPSDAAIWGAFKNVDAEFAYPLRAEEADSAFNLRGLASETELTVTDSIVWEPTVLRHASVFDPTIKVSVPYSELERKSVVVTCHFPVARIFHEMLGSLIIVALLSMFLIVCLVLQFATILKFSRLDNMRNSFITTMIHELKRPISTLKMCVSGLDNERMMEDPSIKKEILSETRTSLDNLSAYFSKLRDITFNNVEQIPLNIQTINLHDLFRTVADATLLPPEKTVVIRNDIDMTIEVSADRSHLYNILNNLVENAVKYSGRSVEITATASGIDGYVEIAVSDNGSGISAGDIRHIFKRFYRGEASAGEQPGMGLGLAYVRLLVDAHGGEITVKSVEGEGTCFTIILPQ